MKKGSGFPQAGGPSAGRPGGAVLEFCKQPPPCGKGSSARHNASSNKNIGGGPSHRIPAEEVFASIGTQTSPVVLPETRRDQSVKELADGPSQNLPAVLFHPRVPDPAEEWQRLVLELWVWHAVCQKPIRPLLSLR